MQFTERGREWSVFFFPPRAGGYRNIKRNRRIFLLEKRGDPNAEEIKQKCCIWCCLCYSCRSFFCVCRKVV